MRHLLNNVIQTRINPVVVIFLNIFINVFILLVEMKFGSFWWWILSAGCGNVCLSVPASSPLDSRGFPGETLRLWDSGDTDTNNTCQSGAACSGSHEEEVCSKSLQVEAVSLIFLGAVMSAAVRTETLRYVTWPTDVLLFFLSFCNLSLLLLFLISSPSNLNLRSSTWSAPVSSHHPADSDPTSETSAWLLMSHEVRYRDRRHSLEHYISQLWWFPATTSLFSMNNVIILDF